MQWSVGEDRGWESGYVATTYVAAILSCPGASWPQRLHYPSHLTPKGRGNLANGKARARRTLQQKNSPKSFQRLSFETVEPEAPCVMGLVARSPRGRPPEPYLTCPRGRSEGWWPLLPPSACRNDRPMQPAEGRIRGGPHLRSEESLFSPRFARPRRPPISHDPGSAQDVSGLVRCRWSVHLLLPAFRRQKQASEPQNRTRLVQTQVRAMWVVGRAVSVVKP